MQQLKSSSLTIVSNACGTLWNLSARNAQDQKSLWDLGAVTMLHSLTQSKHKTISTCSSAALRNLLHAKPSGMLDMVSKGAAAGVTCLPARKHRNMVREMSDQLRDTPKVDVDDQLSTPRAVFNDAVHLVDTTYDVDHILDPRSDKLVLCKNNVSGCFQQDLQRIPGRHPEKVCDCTPVDTALNLLNEQSTETNTCSTEMARERISRYDRFLL